MRSEIVMRYVPLAGLLIAAAAAAALGLALLSQYGFGLQPCVLCIWQRWPHVAAVALGLAVWMLRTRPGASAALLGLAAAAELATGGIGVFHVGVEQGWWQGTAECGTTASGNDLAALKAQIMNQPIVRCDEVAFAVLGISMAGWNAVLAATLAAIGVGAILRDVKRVRENRT
jgi:disulfide bond formation protein DsbB